MYNPDEIDHEEHQAPRDEGGGEVAMSAHRYHVNAAMQNRDRYRAIRSVPASMWIDTLRPGDRVFRWWDSGAFGATQQPLTVIRVNGLTVTVRTDQGSTFRLPHAEVAGRVDWEEEQWSSSYVRNKRQSGQH